MSEMKRKRKLEEAHCLSDQYDESSTATTSSEDSYPGSAANRLEELMDPKRNRSKLFSNLSEKPIEKPRRSVVLRAFQQTLTSSTPFNNRHMNREYFLNTSPIDINTDTVENNRDKNKENHVIILQTGRVINSLNETNLSENIANSPVPVFCGKPTKSSIEGNKSQYGHNKNRNTEKSVPQDGKICTNAIENCTNVSKHTSFNFKKPRNSNEVKRNRTISEIPSNVLSTSSEDESDKNANESYKGHNKNGSTEKSVPQDGKICTNAIKNCTNVSKHTSSNFKKPRKSNEVKRNRKISEIPSNVLSTSSEDESDKNANESFLKSQTSKSLYKRMQRLEEEMKLIKSDHIMKTYSDDTNVQATRRRTTGYGKLKNPCTTSVINSVTRHPEYVPHINSNNTWTCERSTSPMCPSPKNTQSIEMISLVLDKSSIGHSENSDVAKKKEKLQRVVDRLSLKKCNELLKCSAERVVKENKNVQTSIHCLNNNSNKIPEKPYDSVLFKTIPNGSRIRDFSFESEELLDISPYTSNNKPWRFNNPPSSSEEMNSIRLNFLRSASEIESERRTKSSMPKQKSYMNGQFTRVSTSSESTALSDEDGSTTKKTSTDLKLTGHEEEFSDDEAKESSGSLTPKKVSSCPIVNLKNPSRTASEIENEKNITRASMYKQKSSAKGEFTRISACGKSTALSVKDSSTTKNTTDVKLTGHEDEFSDDETEESSKSLIPKKISTRSIVKLKKLLQTASEIESEKAITRASTSKQKSYMKGQLASSESTALSVKDSSTTKNISTDLKLTGHEEEFIDDEIEESSKSLTPKKISSSLIVKLKELFVPVARLPIKQTLNLQPDAAKSKRHNTRYSSKGKNVAKGHYSDSSEFSLSEEIMLNVSKKSKKELKCRTSVKSINQVNIDSSLKESTPVAGQDLDIIYEHAEEQESLTRNTIRKTSSSQRSKKQNKWESNSTNDVSAEQNCTGLRRSSRVHKPRKVTTPLNGVWQLRKSRLKKGCVISIANEDDTNNSFPNKSTTETLKKQNSTKANDKKSITVKNTRERKKLVSTSHESQEDLNYRDEGQPGPSNIAQNGNRLQFSSDQESIFSTSGSNPSNKDSGAFTMCEETNLKGAKRRKASSRRTSEAKNIQQLNTTVNCVTDCRTENYQLLNFEDSSFKKGANIFQKSKKFQDNSEIAKIILGPSVRTRVLKDDKNIMYHIIEGTAIFHIKGKNHHVHANNVFRILAGVPHVVENCDCEQPLSLFEVKLTPRG